MTELQQALRPAAAVKKRRRRGGPLGSRWTPYVFLAPAAIILLVFQILPVLQEIHLSFTKTSLLSPNLNVWVGLANFKAIFGDQAFLQTLETTFIYLIVCVVGPVSVGLLTALLLNGRFPGRGLARALITVPWAAPGVAVALVLTWMLNAQYGIVNRVLNGVGLGVPGGNIINSGAYALPAILIITIWQLFPFCTVVLVSALQSVSMDVIEAAKMDGAGAWWVFRVATWPVIKPTVSLLVILSAIWSLRMFEIIWIMTEGGPNGSTTTLVINLYSQAFVYHNPRQRGRDGRGRRRYLAGPRDSKLAAQPEIATGGQLIFRHRLGIGARSLVVLAVLGLAVFPLYWMFVTSLTSNSNLYSSHVQFFPDFSHIGIYAQALADGRVGRWLLNSLLISAGTAVLTLALGVPLGYALSRFSFRGKVWIAAGLLITQALPEALLVVPLFGMLRGIDLLNSQFGLILVDSAFVLPVVALILKGAIDGISRELDEAARVDGCGPLTVLLRIISPLAGPSIAASAVIGFFSAWNEYVFAVTFLFDPALQPASVGLAGFVGENVTPLDTVMAVGIMYTLPAVVFYLFAQKYVVSGMTAGSVKG